MGLKKKLSERLPCVPLVSPAKSELTFPNTFLLNSVDLQMRYDEKSLFPKYILDMEAKMKATHALGMRVSRGARARGESIQVRSRGSHDVPQASNKKMTSWRVLLTSKGKDM